MKYLYTSYIMTQIVYKIVENVNKLIGNNLRHQRNTVPIFGE